MAKSQKLTFDSGINKCSQFNVSKVYGQFINFLIQWWAVVESDYELKIAMDKSNLTIDEWINYFKSEGLYLTKERRRIEFIKIESYPRQ